MSDYRIVVRVQNGRIYERIRSMGFKTISAFCKANGLSQNDVGRVLNLKLSPLNNKGSFRPCVLRLSDALQSDPADLFTERQYEAVPSNVRDFLVEEQHMAQLLDSSKSDPSHRLALVEMAAGIQRRANLSQRHQQVIDMRYKRDMTYDEIAKAMGITGDRVRQIEANALRKMRHPDVIKDVELADLDS